MKRSLNSLIGKRISGPVSVIVMVRDGCVTEASEIWKKFLIEWRGKFDDKDWEAS